MASMLHGHGSLVAYRVSDTYRIRIRHGYVSWTYPRAGPYWAGKPQIGYVSGLPNTAQLPTHLKEHIAPVALPQLPHAQPLVPLPHARLAPPLVAAARRSSLRPRRRRRATAAGTPGPGAPRAATKSRSSPRGDHEPEPRLHRCRDQRTSARLAAAKDLRPAQGAKELLPCSCSLPSPVAPACRIQLAASACRADALARRPRRSSSLLVPLQLARACSSAPPWPHTLTCHAPQRGGKGIRLRERR